MSSTNAYNPRTGEWNDSLSGDFLWSRNNYGEARPDVMTPLLLEAVTNPMRNQSNSRINSNNG